MEELQRGLLRRLRRLRSFATLGYLEKWLPAALLIGAAAGIASIAFQSAINWATTLFLGSGAGFMPPVPTGVGKTAVAEISKRWAIPLVTTIGGLISGFIVYRFGPEAKGTGCDAAIDAFHNRKGVIPARIPFIKLIASAITIGSGGSAGTQGPVAQISAGLGSSIGRLFKFNAHDCRLAVAIGIGAGVGSIFKAPLGGAIFSIEILYLQGFEIEALIPSAIATVIGYSIFASWAGFTPLFGQHLNIVFQDPMILISYAILGICCGLIGILYSGTFYRLHNLFQQLKIPGYWKPAIGGLATGLIGMALPQVLGLGYGWIQLAMKPAAIPLLIMIALVFAKIVATSFSIGSGGSGGIFAPSLVIGAMLSASLWAIMYPRFTGMVPSSPEPFVIAGMLALFGAIAHTPVAATLMICEMSGTYTIVAPAMLAVCMACLVVGKNTIYRSQVHSPASSPAHKYEHISPLLRTMQVKQAMASNFECLSPRASIEEAAITIQKTKTAALVLDDTEHLIGIIANEDILPIPMELRCTTRVDSIMSTNLIVAYPDESLEQALEVMAARGVAILPVVDRKKPAKLLGMATRNSIIRAYESEAKKMLKKQ